jgi:hypothetical protein
MWCVSVVINTHYEILCTKSTPFIMYNLTNHSHLQLNLLGQTDTSICKSSPMFLGTDYVHIFRKLQYVVPCCPVWVASWGRAWSESLKCWKIFIPWHACLPKKILLNSVTAKASRYITFSFSLGFCGLVVRVSGYRYRGLGFYSRRYQIFWVVVGLERGPLSLVRSTEGLLE